MEHYSVSSGLVLSVKNVCILEPSSNPLRDYLLFFHFDNAFWIQTFDVYLEIEMGDSRPDIPIPDGLQKLMQDFVVTVLRQQPDDLLNHAVEYFNKLKVRKI